jgi:hypothetical protein
MMPVNEKPVNKHAPDIQFLNSCYLFIEGLVKERIALVFKVEVNNQAEEDYKKEMVQKIKENISNSILAQILNSSSSESEMIKLTAIIMLAFVPHLEIGFFERVISESQLNEKRLISLGLVNGSSYPGYLPTLETVLFVLGGNNIEERINLLRYFDEDSILTELDLVSLQKGEASEPYSASRLVMNIELVELFIRGFITPPQFSIDFPAQHLQTPLNEEDLVLPKETTKKIEQIKNWISYNQKLSRIDAFNRHIKPGFRALFTGPPGTGKTLTATLIGQSCSLEVYRVDLSMVVSKFIGETEKNLSRLFDKARYKNWILLFDEADALFGQRTNVRDAHDKYANQEIAYLLQRIEDHPGITILTSNLPGNIDKAFVRRFDLVVHFPLPGAEERLKIWESILPEQLRNKDINLEKIVQEYELSGASIINAVKNAALQCIGRKPMRIGSEVLLESIKNELRKEGRVI